MTKTNGPSKTKFIVVIAVAALVGFVDSVEHPNAVATGIEAIAFKTSRLFIVVPLLVPDARIVFAIISF
jgi:hypothetical protein